MAQGIHTEETFEALIEAHLVDHGGYESGSPDAYDRDRALLTDTVIAFVRDTQPKVWEQLQAIHKDKLDGLFLDALCKALDQRGSLEVLRHVFKFYGQKIRLAYFEPGNTLNPAVWDLYEKNRVTVVRQVRYDPKNDNELDLVLFLNGLPIATAELKNPVTGQKVGHAKRQYREDRDSKAPIFRWTKRALVHFAVDTDEVWMSTKLAGLSTRFLPFNKGDGHGKGNLAVEGKHRTHYLWEEVWKRQRLLDLVGSFIHLQTETRVDPNTGKTWEEKTLIFPRYHQSFSVRPWTIASRPEVDCASASPCSASTGNSSSVSAWRRVGGPSVLIPTRRAARVRTRGW